MSLAIMASLLPFVLRLYESRAARAENIQTAKDIRLVRDALEKYMEAHKQTLLAPMGANITRVKIADLAEFGAAVEHLDKFQARIIKSRDIGGRAVLQGTVIFDSPEISPLRTREIASLGGDSAGFADRGSVIGAAGTWRTRANIFDAKFGSNAIFGQTSAVLSSGDFLWRVPSPDTLDATMASDLSLGGYSIKDALNVIASSANFSEVLKAGEIKATKALIVPRIDWDSPITIVGDTLVQGQMTANAGGIVVNGDAYLDSSAKFSKVTAMNLRTGDLNLSGLTIGGTDEPAILKIGGTIDMVQGRVTTLTATIGYAGTVAPQLEVSERLEDSSAPSYYWNFSGGDAVLSDISISGLAQMMRDAVKTETGSPRKTDSENTMGMVAANSNATVADFANALSAIQMNVRRKYNLLGLQ